VITREEERLESVCTMISRTSVMIFLAVLFLSSWAQEVVQEQKPREAKQLNEPEQKYDLELSFPVESDEATNVDDGRRARIDSLIQEILLATQDDQVNSLPGTLLDPSSISFEESFRCDSGEVVIDDQCVPCPAGTFFDVEHGSQCTKCPIGEYNSEIAKLECQKCPIIQDLEGVTESEGATSASECKELCDAGHYYDKITDLCRPCGHGRYQGSKGKFSCELCGVGLTTRTKKSLSRDECRADCEDGHQLSFNGECEVCQLGTYRTQGLHRGCQPCPSDRTTSKSGSTAESDCNLPICVPGQYLNATNNQCQACPMGQYQPESQQTQCIDCPANTSTGDIDLSSNVGATNKSQCTNPCSKARLCDRNAHCLFQPNAKRPNAYECSCKVGYKGNGTLDDPCVDNCEDHCSNDGQCLKTKEGEPYCQCAGSFTGEHCKDKSEFAYIAGGIAGAVLFVIVLVLLIWMICVRSGRGKRNLAQEKFAQPGADGVNGSQVNFYYGAPAPYAESIAPSQHGSTYAHYYEDEEDGWGMPNFYDTYGKNSKIARSNGSLYNAGMYGPQYAPQGELYDRLGRHAYQPRSEDKSGNDTTSESDDDRGRGGQ